MLDIQLRVVTRREDNQEAMRSLSPFERLQWLGA